MDRNSLRMLCAKPTGVATREGGVDRNSFGDSSFATMSAVATREGGVDRNAKVIGTDNLIPVATREGGVDRNIIASGCSFKNSCRHPRGWRG